MGQVLVKPNLLRDINEEYTVHHLEEATIVRKLANLSNGNYSMESNGTPRLRRLFKFSDCNDTEKYCERLKEIEADKRDLDKLKSSSAFQRNFVYPFGMLLILFFTGITVLLVVQNTLELLIGIKALPLSTRVIDNILISTNWDDIYTNHFIAAIHFRHNLVVKVGSDRGRTGSLHHFLFRSRIISRPLHNAFHETFKATSSPDVSTAVDTQRCTYFDPELSIATIIPYFGYAGFF